MINIIEEFFKWISLTNYKNWEIYEKRDWSLEMEGWSKPRIFYRHKKCNYFITNVYVSKPLHITDLINRFLLEYKNKTLLMNETMYVISN